jgi:homoserine dehydrogenase
MHFKLAFIGFGNVGRSLARLLLEQSDVLAGDYGIVWSLTGIATRRMGWCVDERGIDVNAALAGGLVQAGAATNTGITTWLDACDADMLFEMSSLDTVAGEPALSYMCTALERGIHVVTANKGPIVYGYQRLRELAVSRGLGLRFESTVMDGAPIFSMFRQALPLARVTSFDGILNSTSNFIIDEIERGSTMEHAVARAQALGLAETDPAADVDGYDAAVKVAVLANVLMDARLNLEAIDRQGIRALSADAIREARSSGMPYKLMCRAWRANDGIHATVKPERVAAHSPFAHVDGTSSVVRFNTDMLPGISIVEHDPTPVTTAYGMLADFIDIARNVIRS